MTIAQYRLEMIDNDDGIRKMLTVGIDAPVPFGEGARCTCTLDGMHDAPFHLEGTDSLQALALALRFAHQRIADEMESGTRFYLDGDDEPLTRELLDAWFAR